MENWKLTRHELPEDGRFVIANIVFGREIYAEYLAYDSQSKQWHHHNGQKLEESRTVTAWQAGPGNLING